ncbi:LptF/LptG family permease [Campylobacter novaezeelandiae]|uniref:LptF/LptG family permease n=1 Tax=Campylobacter novaezeelandiae TaxID=2267891 RepID=A0A4Q9JV14_9BACT|nr:LptF/LptG family permease [Campylobacter novaezeelandiae]QWU80658.1 lipooligosaccharide transport system, ABC transporter permease component LptG [Campylobacter novaezeelandiae]TBR79709.1 LptF/LptG family permease [Campylobacter novaezeelandiae]TBR80317.1 LptF/LptG family permease [Campylobacter novaezeelandiae]TBR81806.1 LptF/LptG family permease [Campylobacter novaezeelandiae]
MWIFFRFISGIYLKNFFIIFLSLLCFFVCIDLLLNFKDLPKSANLDLLYVVFLACSAVFYLLPISLIFALILSLINMIRSNEFVSFYALGLSKNLVILFPFLWALFFCFVFIGLNFTSFAYANDYKRNIIKNGVLIKQGGGVFLKFNDDLIYIDKVKSAQNEVEDIKIFNTKDLNLTSFVIAKKAIFNDDFWILKEGSLTLLPNEYNVSAKGLQSKEFKDLKTLEGFKPKIIESVANNSDYSIKDALEGLFLFKEQGISLHSIKISLYKLVFTPFFAPFLMLIIYYFFPITARFFNLAFVSFIFFLVSFGVWGLLFLLTRLSENGVILTEFGIILPIVLLALFALFMYYKNR